MNAVNAVCVAPKSQPDWLATRLGVLGGSFRHSLGSGLLYLVVLEASLLGSGQLLHFGGVTLKMVLFGFSILYALICLFAGDSISMGSMLLLSYLSVCTVNAFLVGHLHGAEPAFIAEDVSPLLYFLILPFFELTMRSRRQLNVTICIIKISALMIAAGYVVVLGALWTGAISVSTLFKLLVDNGDFMYDGLSWRVFYKGSIYLAVAVILFAFGKGWQAKLGMCVSFLALVLTVTRGFMLAIFAVALVFVIIRPGRSISKLAYFCIVIVFGCLLAPVFFSMVSDKAESDSTRIVTVTQVLDGVNPLSVIVGHGLGVGVEVRPEHMEIAYLEIFHKQGAVGLIWIASLALLLVARFRRAARIGNSRLACPLLLSALFVFIESLTNPFINNPIGMSIIIISLAGLKVLGDRTDLHVQLSNKQEAVFG